jgi:hypothetical protein
MSGLEQKKLAERFARMRADGLCDLKFSLNVAEATVEQVCTDVNRVYELVDAGNFVTLNGWNDSNRKL